MSRDKKTNPKKIPATQYDVERARREGREEGYTTMMQIFLFVFLDAFHASHEDLEKMGERLKFYLQEINAGRIKPADIVSATGIEYDYDLELK